MHVRTFGPRECVFQAHLQVQSRQDRDPASRRKEGTGRPKIEFRENDFVGSIIIRVQNAPSQGARNTSNITVITDAARAPQCGPAFQAIKKLRGTPIHLYPKDLDPLFELPPVDVDGSEVEFGKASNDNRISVDLREISEIAVSQTDRLASIRPSAASFGATRRPLRTRVVHKTFSVQQPLAKRWVVSDEPMGLFASPSFTIRIQTNIPRMTVYTVLKLTDAGR